jgi:acyl-CoA reductase-like NAD-dependent aldehyde dehydrogenase
VSIGAFGATGQKCTATRRVIVERSVVDDFAHRLAEQAGTWTLGDPLDPATSLGPLASAPQLATVLGYLGTAEREGARAVAGGARAEGALADGYFVPPTVLADVEPSHTVAQEEVFGPVAALLAVDSYDEAVAVANGTPYGLSASLYTTDLAKALHFSEHSRSGVVKVNQATSGTEHHVPFGGTKASGHGPPEQGRAARDFFTESKTVYISMP